MGKILLKLSIWRTNFMISILSFIIVIFGCLNWLSIGLFQYDIVAGLFGYQGSIFSRMVYIIVGVAACWLLFSVIKNKGSLNAKKLKHDERPIYNEEAKQEQVLRQASPIELQKAVELKTNKNGDETSQQGASPESTSSTGRNHNNLQNI